MNGNSSVTPFVPQFYFVQWNPYQYVYELSPLNNQFNPSKPSTISKPIQIYNTFHPADHTPKQKTDDEDMHFFCFTKCPFKQMVREGRLDEAKCLGAHPKPWYSTISGPEMNMIHRTPTQFRVPSYYDNNMTIYPGFEWKAFDLPTSECTADCYHSTSLDYRKEPTYVRKTPLQRNKSRESKSRNSKNDSKTQTKATQTMTGPATAINLTSLREFQPTRVQWRNNENSLKPRISPSKEMTLREV